MHHRDDNWDIGELKVRPDVFVTIEAPISRVTEDCVNFQSERDLHRNRAELLRRIKYTRLRGPWVLDRPAFQLLIELFDNYEHYTGIAEMATIEELSENNAFLTDIMTTAPMLMTTAG